MSTEYTTIEGETVEMNMVNATTQTFEMDETRRDDDGSVSSMSPGSNHGVKVNMEELEIKEPLTTMGAVTKEPLATMGAVTEMEEPLNKTGITITAQPKTPTKSGSTLPAQPETPTKTGFTIAGQSEKENREAMSYFGSWGPQQHRDRPIAQLRKVIIRGDPEWQFSPTAEFIASLVFGGPLEQLQCMINSAAVTFIHAADAQLFYNKTANGIVFRADSEGIYYADVRMAVDPTPTSSYVEDCFNQGATRIVRATGIDPVVTLTSLRAGAEGKTSLRGIPIRKLERLEDTVNEGGHRVVTFHFCDIRHAIAFRGEMIRRWEEVNFQFGTDPCAIARAPRLKVRPVTRPF